jgi:hypothetical protein
MTSVAPPEPRTVSNAARRGAHAAVRRRAARFRLWTRRLHTWAGLYLLFFLWLFSVSGLVLNHSKWAVAQFWKARQESTTARAIQVPNATGDVAIAKDLMRQLAIAGEIGETKRRPDGAITFDVVKPGRIVRVEARLDSARANVTTTRLNAWGVLDALHKLTGVKVDEPERRRDWVLTWVWSAAMDALALGMIFLVLSSLYLWYRLPAKRGPGLAALALGVLACAFFLYGFGVRLG